MDKVSFFEIPADNLKSAQKFFKGVFGWKTEAWKDDYVNITTVETDKNWMPKEKGAINGAIFKRKSKNEKPLLMIEVPSIEKYLQKVKKAGGKVVTGRAEAGEWGWWAEIADTEGNVSELWEDNE